MLAMPITQVFWSRMTVAFARGSSADTMKEYRKAALLMTVLVLPTAVLIAVFSKTILLLWTGMASVAESAHVVLSILVVGTALVACSYPSVHIMYAKGRLRPVIVINVFCLALIFPSLILLVSEFGITGAALSWAAYGTLLFLLYGYVGLREVGHLDCYGRSIGELVLVLGVIGTGAWLAALQISSWASPGNQLASMAACFMFAWLAAAMMFRDGRAAVLGIGISCFRRAFRKRR